MMEMLRARREGQCGAGRGKEGKADAHGLPAGLERRHRRERVSERGSAR